MRSVSSLAVASGLSALLLGVLVPACGGSSDDATDTDDASADGSTGDGSGGDGSKPASDGGLKGDAGGKIECTKASDCDSGVCNIATGKCSSPSCSDGTKN